MDEHKEEFGNSADGDLSQEKIDPEQENSEESEKEDIPTGNEAEKTEEVALEKEKEEGTVVNIDSSFSENEIVKEEKAEEVLSAHSLEEERQQFKEISQHLQRLEETGEAEQETFSLVPFEYKSKEFEIDHAPLNLCRDTLEQYGYLFVTDKKEDLRSKYFVKILFESIDPYGKVYSKVELLLENTKKVDFLDLEQYLVTLPENQLIILDLCKFGHVEKELFLNSFTHYMKKSGNSVKFREMLARKKIILMLVAYDEDLSERNEFLNSYKIISKNEKEIDETSGNSVEVLLEERSGEKIEHDLLFITTIFEEITPLELQEVLEVIFDEEEKILWKQQRISLLKRLHLKSQVSSHGGMVITFDGTLKGSERTILQKLREEDPFFVSELFDKFEKDPKLLQDILMGYKSIGFVNGFFRLVEATVTDDPQRLSLEWFENMFLKDRDSGNDVTYFFSLASCAVQVATVQGDKSFPDRLAAFFYEKQQYWSLYYLVEYFSHLDYFDPFNWYKKLLSVIGFGSSEKRLRALLYQSIEKAVHEELCKVELLLSWVSSGNKNVAENAFYMAVRMASDSIKSNRRWIFKTVDALPFLLNESVDEAILKCERAYLLFLYGTTEKPDTISDELYKMVWNENINKLFYTKILGLISYYGLEKREREKIVSSITRDVAKLLGRKKYSYIVLILLWLIEWYFVLSQYEDKKSVAKQKEILFSLLFDVLGREDIRVLRNGLLEISTLLLKLSSLTRRYKELSTTYRSMRQLVRELPKEIHFNKK